jgi:hypothetical protein
MNRVKVEEFKAMQKHGTSGKARGKHTPGTMNKTEAAYAAMLEIRKAAGEIAGYWFEAITLKLAHDCRLTPDFFIVHRDGRIEFIDVKGTGPIQEDSVIKLRVAARQFPMFGFAMEKRQTRSQGGGWARKEFVAT